MFNSYELEYYSRQLTLENFGTVAQSRLKQSSVFVVGAGGLGCPALLYLAGAGIGNITIADEDVVRMNNLHRQVLYDINDIGKNKAKAAQEKLIRLNPNINFKVITKNVTELNIHQLLKNSELVIDASDNFDTRILLGEYTAKKKIPLVFAAIFAFEGQLTVFNFQNGPVFSDLFPVLPGTNTIQDCTLNGVVGFVPGIMGCLQAAEAVKIITGIGLVMSGRLLLLDFLTMDKTEIKIKVNREKTISDLKIQTNINEMVGDINISELKERLDTVFLLDVREPWEFENYNLGGTLIPIREIPGRISEIPKDRDIVVVCESGIRSQSAARFISDSYPGIKVYNLKSGLKVLKEK